MNNSIILKGVLILLCALVSITSTGAANSEPGIAEADSAYAHKDYVRAIELYQNVARAKGVSASLLFNMGNSYFQTGDYGNAMLYWQRARRLNPSSKAINSNISYLRSRVEDANKAELKGKRLKVAPDENSFFQSVYKSIAENTSSNTWAFWGGLTFLIFVTGAALYIFSSNVAVKKSGFFGGLLSLLLSIGLMICAIYAARAMDSRDEGVVIAFKIPLLTEPEENQQMSVTGGGNPSKSVKKNPSNVPVLTKGTEVRIVSEETDIEGHVTWYKVRLNSDYIGWIPAESLSII